MDGLPLFKSSCGELLPILVSVMNIPSLVKEVFPVGIYYGNKKPNSSELFMEDFEEEIIDLIKNGIQVISHVLNVNKGAIL